MSKDRKDKIMSVILLTLAVFIFVGGARIPQASAGVGPGPGSFPMFLGSVLAALSLALYWTAGRKKKKEEPKEAAKALDEIQEIDEPARDKIKRVVTCIVLLSVYFLVLPYFGFLAATLLYSGGFLMLLYREKAKATLIPAITITLFAFVMFELALGIPLPAFMEAVK